MRSSLILIGVLAAAVSAAQCGGGGSNSTPSAPAPTTPSIVTVSIAGLLGNRSYVPDPVPVASGGQVMFKNNDLTTAVGHHIVMDDGSIDFGNLAPGASSSAKSVGVGGNFHCVNHPSMVGSINGAVAPTPPPGSGDGY
jgi:plastocyanin